MTTPLLALEFDPDPRTLPLLDSAAERPDQRLDVGKHHGRRSRPSKDRCERLAVP